MYKNIVDIKTPQHYHRDKTFRSGTRNGQFNVTTAFHLGKKKAPQELTVQSGL